MTLVALITAVAGLGSPVALPAGSPDAPGAPGVHDALCCVAEAAQQGPMSRYAPEEEVTSFLDDWDLRVSDEARALCAGEASFDLRTRDACEQETGRALMSLLEAGVPWSLPAPANMPAPEEDAPVCNPSDGGACGVPPAPLPSRPWSTDALRVVFASAGSIPTPNVYRVRYLEARRFPTDGYDTPPDQPPRA